MAYFALLESPKLISRINLSDRKIMKFPHCVDPSQQLDLQIFYHLTKMISWRQKKPIMCLLNFRVKNGFFQKFKTGLIFVQYSATCALIFDARWRHRGNSKPVKCSGIASMALYY